MNWLHTPARSRLISERVNKLLFIQLNRRVLQRKRGKLGDARHVAVMDMLSLESFLVRDPVVDPVGEGGLGLVMNCDQQ